MEIKIIAKLRGLAVPLVVIETLGKRNEPEG
jgi:hypothetical protein